MDSSEIFEKVITNVSSELLTKQEMILKKIIVCLEVHNMVPCKSPSSFLWFIIQKFDNVKVELAKGRAGLQSEGK